jgi:hypothetical protein
MRIQPKKTTLLSGLLIALAALTGCKSVNVSENMTGMFNTVAGPIQGFVVLDLITVHATETHSSSPFGFVKYVEGSKITYADLVHEAEQLGADDIVDVRIDMTTTGKTSVFDWLTGWTRTFTYTGTALAIKYSSR